MSGYFQMQDPKGYVEKAKGAEPGQFDFAAWKMTDATVLVKTRVWPAGNASCDPGGAKMCADVYVYHVPTGEKLASKRFRGSPDAARYLGHAIANKVLVRLTGTAGIFGTRLAAVGWKVREQGDLRCIDLDGHGVRRGHPERGDQRVPGVVAGRQVDRLDLVQEGEPRPVRQGPAAPGGPGRSRT